MADKDFVIKNGLVVSNTVLVATGSNVGIGTSSPDATLKVSGTANVTGNVRLSGHKLDISANTIFTGNVEVQNTMYVDKRLFVGNTDTMVTLTNPIIQAVDNFNGFVMISSQNLSQEDDACADLLIYADNTDGLSFFNDVGLNNSKFDGTIHRVSANTLADSFVLGETVFQSNSSANIAVGVVRDVTTINSTSRSVKISVANGATYVNTSGGNLALKGVTSGTNAAILVAVPFGAVSSFSRRNYPFTVGVRNDGYLYNANSALSIGTTFGGIRLFTNTVPSVSFTGSSNVITTSSTTSLYQDLLLTGTNIPAGAWITQVTNSTSFKISSLTTGTSSGTYTVTDPYYEAAGNPIVFHTNGMLAENEIARFSGNGNFTIGDNTAARSTKLHVQGTSNVTGIARFGSTLIVNNNVSVGNATVRSDINASGNVSVNSGVFATSVNVGTFSVNSTGHIVGNVNFDSNTLFVDSLNNRIGVGTNVPDVTLTVAGSANVTGDMRVGGNLIITGTTTSVGTSTSTGDFIPTTNGYSLGNTSSRWGVFGNNAILSGNLSVAGIASITGAVTLSNTLVVTGAATLSNSISVVGAVVQGNSTVNTSISGGQLEVSNSTSKSTITPNGLVVGNVTINSTNIGLSSNIVVNTSSLSIGNSSVNTFANSSTIIVGGVTLNSVTISSYVNTSANYTFAGIHTHNANVAIAANSTLLIGTSTINSTAILIGSTVVNSSAFTGTASNASLLNNKSESNLNVNNALTSNNASFLGTVAAASYIVNTESRTLSGNLSFTGTNTSILTNFRVVNSSANVLFAGSNGNIGIGTNSPTVKLHISGTDAVLVPSGNTTQRPTGANGHFRYNNETNEFEGYADGAWGAIAGGGATGYYAKGGAATIGTAADANNIFRVNGQALYNSTTIDSTENALCAGPLVVQTGVTLLVSTGGRVVVS